MSEKYEINEDYFGLVELDETTADCINSSIKAFLVSLGLPFDHCREQGYDRAQNFPKVMSVELPRDLRMITRLLFLCIRCLAHSVNLYLQSKGLQMHQGSFKLHYEGCSAEVFSKKTNNL